MNIGIFYASAGGTTKVVVDSLVEAFGVDDDNVVFMEDDYDDLEQFEPFDVLFIGSSTWGKGDPHFSWVDAMMEIENNGDFEGKKVAFFGAGDCNKHGEQFCSALGKFYKIFTKAGAEVVGFVDKDEYNYKFSQAQIGDKLCGLAIDNQNEESKTPIRVNAWIENLKSELGV